MECKRLIPWVLIDTATVPDGGELRLKQRGAEYSIMLGANELMNSRLSGSEEALANLSLARLAHLAEPRVLIGGLGMGFTLRAALGQLGPSAHVTVAELVPAVVDWARGPMASVFAGCLDDPRVVVHVGDVGQVIRAKPVTWDAILLDVDNGPEGLTRVSNDALYSQRGLNVARAALRQGGVFSVWSSGTNRSFTQRLYKAGFQVEETTARAQNHGGGARHVIWLATKD